MALSIGLVINRDIRPVREVEIVALLLKSSPADSLRVLADHYISGLASCAFILIATALKARGSEG